MEKEKIEKNKFPNWSFRLNDDDGSCFRSQYLKLEQIALVN